MAHKLITSMSKFDRILKNGLLTGNSNNIPQVQLKFSEVKLLPQPRAFTHKLRTKFDKPLRPKEDNNGGAPKVKEKGTAENKYNYKRTSKLSFTSQPKSAPNALNQGYKSRWVAMVVQGGLGRRAITVFWNMVGIVILVVCQIEMVIIILCWQWHAGENIHYKEITLIDFVDNYLNQRRVVKPEYLEERWIQFQTPGDTTLRRVRINNLDFYEVSGLLSTIMAMVNAEKGVPDNTTKLEITSQDLKLSTETSEQENRIPDKGQSFPVSLQACLTIQLLEYGRKAWRLLTLGRLKLTATISEMIFRK